MMIDSSQQSFINAPETHIRLLAPAGAGKTMCILERCLYLDTLAPKKKYLIISFTSGACEEIKRRLTLPKFSVIRGKIKVSTLNSYGNSILNDKSTFPRLINEKWDKANIVKNDLQDIWGNLPILSMGLKEVGSRGHKIGQVLDVFDCLKGLSFNHEFSSVKLFKKHYVDHLRYIDSLGLRKYLDKEFLQKFIDINDRVFGNANKTKLVNELIEFWFQAVNRLQKQGYYTFEDQKYFAYHYYKSAYSNRKMPKVNQYTDIIIDEFQDINVLDLNFIKELVRVNESTLTIVGDDDQAIFEWRGAVPKFILDPTSFLGTAFDTYILENNYRSPKNIVEASKRLIRFNRNRLDKNTVPLNHEDVEIRKVLVENHHLGVKTIIDLVADIVGRGERTAIISRKRSQLLPYQMELMGRKLLYYAKEDIDMSLSRAFEDLLEIISFRDAVDKISVKSGDNLIKMMNYVKRYKMDSRTEKAIRSYFQEKEVLTIRQGLESLYSCSIEVKRGPASRFYDPIMCVLDAKTVASCVKEIQDKFQGLLSNYSKGDDDFYYLDPPFAFLLDYAQKFDSDFLSFSKEISSVLSMIRNQNNKANAEDHDVDYSDINLHLMTALRAKGKEFDNVIVLDCNDDIWPLKAAKDSVEAIEQERRIFYVAITRAKKRLILNISVQIGGKSFLPSPFLDEMGLDD